MVEPLVVRIRVEQDAGGRVVDLLQGAEAAPDGAAQLPAGRRPDLRAAQAWDQEAGPAEAASCPEAALASEDLGLVEAPASGAAGGAESLDQVVCSSLPSEAVLLGHSGAFDSGVGLEVCHLVVESGTAAKNLQ